MSARQLSRKEKASESVVQEKAALALDLKRLRKHYDAYEPTLLELQVPFLICLASTSDF